MSHICIDKASILVPDSVKCNEFGTTLDSSLGQYVLAKKAACSHKQGPQTHGHVLCRYVHCVHVQQHSHICLQLANAFLPQHSKRGGKSEQKKKRVRKLTFANFQFGLPQNIQIIQFSTLTPTLSTTCMQITICEHVCVCVSAQGQYHTQSCIGNKRHMQLVRQSALHLHEVWSSIVKKGSFRAAVCLHEHSWREGLRQALLADGQR